MDGYEIGNDGYCVDVLRCLEEKDGECIRCIDEEYKGYSYCANKQFGCVPTFLVGCLKCDDILDFYKCTECKEGYSSLYGGCTKIQE